MKIKTKGVLIAGVVVLMAAAGVAALVLNNSTGKKETDSKNVSISNAGSIIDKQVQTQTAGILSGLENVGEVTPVQETAGGSDIYNKNGGEGYDENGAQTGLDLVLSLGVEGELCVETCYTVNFFQRNIHLGSDDQTLTLKLRHFRLHIPLASDRQGLRRQLAAVGAKHP